MQVHKFGGASISTVERIQMLPSIISTMRSGKKLFVISALGKTTNALEKIVSLYFAGDKDASLQAVATLKASHLAMATALLQDHAIEDCCSTISTLFQQLELLLEQHKDAEYNFYYDQAVCFGELLSSTLVSFFLKERGIKNDWLDAREVIKTNKHFREAGILWDVVRGTMKSLVSPALDQSSVIITQGFIGRTLDGQSTTLGREGSDFTAAVFANLLHADSVTIWKDVEGVMNADPKLYGEAAVIPHLDYKEVIEMSYYGAQVIHPKTIKPLQNESIPLYARSFINPTLDGTVIDNIRSTGLPPMIVYKFNQVLLSFQTKDFSFIEGKPSRRLSELFAKALVKANLTQNTAISILLCIDDIQEKKEFILDQTHEFETTSTPGLTLLTIRHHTPEIIEKLTKGKRVVLEQKTELTVQILYLQ